ncbi:hypothetical protein SAV14893_091080 [Streptomyces avermitilis]|uniref:Transposase DDE domain-containing protein n=1 Tax=Streptomyces avermitilis TaxID=33903 RepID=A0A4D4N9X2_STRAX|nr:hypothetical protein SAVMC3_05450 [Streptomyces avermitilis]GDY69715.1 hypothetical protein SAV14893_091080 [Streptomyces avermitilis]GDY79967.1 hypothetical protein SAV31267_094520 [Streptomyces avermitilis]
MIPKRWAVERTYGWLMLNRRLARDYKTLRVHSEAMTHIAMTDLMAAVSFPRCAGGADQLARAG